MSDAGDAFGYFLKEYKKRLPITEENKDFHEHIDYMIKYFRTNSVIYQTRWDDWISPNDERYWRNPTEGEKNLIRVKHQEKAKVYKKEGSHTAVVLASCLLSLMGVIGFLWSLLQMGDYHLFVMVFNLVIVLQGLLTILGELGAVPLAIWGWLY
jgi:hypothetical protein